MKRVLAAILLTSLSLVSHADIWKWTDANGDVHFVDTRTPIYTWVDDYGMVQYADKPGHEDAVSVDLVWHSAGDDVEEAEKTSGRGSMRVYPGETPEERLEREAAEQYYCTRARQIYDSYLTAPRLYETDDDGEKVYLSEEQAVAKIAETEKLVAELCQQ